MIKFLLFVLIVYIGWKLIQGLVSGNRTNSDTRPNHTYIKEKYDQRTQHMGIFDRFKKKTPDYDPNNITIHDLRTGFMFDYDLKTWIIKEEYAYDWGSNYFTREFKVDSGDDSAYLHIDENDDLIMIFSGKVMVRAIDENIPEEIINHQQPPKKLSYKDTIYYLDKESPGYFSDDPENDDSWTEMISWDYYDEKGNFTISVEQWGERDFEASHGVMVKDYEITNILPGS